MALGFMRIIETNTIGVNYIQSVTVRYLQPVTYSPFRYIQSVPLHTVRSVTYSPFRYLQPVPLHTVRYFTLAVI